MRVARLVFSFLLILSSSPRLNSQQSTTTPQRDARAVDILKQCLNLAGGVSTIGAVADYTASGAITYHWAGKDVDGNVTLRGRGLDQFRMDASLPTGVRSWAASRGVSSQLAEDGSVSRTRGFATLNPSSFVLPYLLLAAALKSPNYNLSFKGVVEVDGHSAYDLQVGTIMPAESNPQSSSTGIDVTDFFIDSSTWEVLMMRDMARPQRNSLAGPVHEIRFSDYRAVSGVVVPFSIKEAVGGQETWVMHLSSVTFNPGLSDSTFQL